MKIATMEDFDVVKDLVVEFIKSTDHISKYAEEDYIDVFLRSMLMASPQTDIILLSDGGFLAGKAVPFTFAPIIVGQEVGWYVHPENRGKGEGKQLLEAFEYWAKNVAGCSLINMGSLDDEVGEYFKKKGYELSERAYIKEL